MSIAYYARSADEPLWSSLWEQQQLAHLLDVAARDPLSGHLQAQLPTSGLILEGGCGLGQYVAYFRRQGYDVFGGDFSLTALAAHRRADADSPLVGLDLLRMPIKDGAFSGHISIGVVEHSAAGPEGLLREAYRTLAPGGVLLLSVPWVNGFRRLAVGRIRQQQRKLQANGAAFYQYAFTRAELRATLEQAGFRVGAFQPYGPGRGLRELRSLRRWYRKAITGPTAGASVRLPSRAAWPGLWRRRLQRWPPAVWMFAHMILAVAHKGDPTLTQESRR